MGSVEAAARILWDYHDLRLEPPTLSDIILVMGSHDLRVAEHGAELMLKGLARWLVLSGGFGKVTPDEWKSPEAEMFREVARRRGVPDEQIIVEQEATNTGENVTFSRRLLEARDVTVTSGVLVSKTYMKRRSYATACKQWPEVDWSTSSPQSTILDSFGSEVSPDRTINLMVGDLQRIQLYARIGYQVPQDIPGHVWAAYEDLIDAGYDEFVISG